jgi:hypothetical protein
MAYFSMVKSFMAWSHRGAIVLGPFFGRTKRKPRPKRLRSPGDFTAENTAFIDEATHGLDHQKHRKMVVFWENHRKTMGKWWFYPLVN